MPSPWRDGTINSLLTGREMPYRILLPANYSASARRYPVLYLLHGLFGSCDNWIALAGIADCSARADLIIVMPEGEDGWYTDGPQPGDKYESYLVKELIPAIDTGFRTITGRSGRGIAGNSMGGYGAFKFALKYPAAFALAASSSGAFEAPRWHDGSPPTNWVEFRPSITRIFGGPTSETRRANDLAELLARFSETEIENLPFLYFDCGADDSFIGANRRLAELFREKGVDFEFRTLAGGHDWEYWTGAGRTIVELASQRLERPNGF